MRPLFVVSALVAAAGLAAQPASADNEAKRFDAAVDAILAQPYQPDYVPFGTDGAFPDQPTANTHPAEDYTSGSIDGDPDFPGWPSAFVNVSLKSGDGAPLLGRDGRDGHGDRPPRTAEASVGRSSTPRRRRALRALRSPRRPR